MRCSCVCLVSWCGGDGELNGRVSLFFFTFTHVTEARRKEREMEAKIKEQVGPSHMLVD